MFSKNVTVNKKLQTKEALKEHRILLGDNVIFEGVCELGDAVTVGDDVVFGNNSKIGRCSVIESGVRIGKNCVIGESSFIGKGVEISDGVSLPDRIFVGRDRRRVGESVDFSATFVYRDGKTESFFDVDRVLIYGPEKIGQNYEVSMSFKDFFKDVKLRRRLKIKQEERRDEYLKAVSSFIGVLKKVADLKNKNRN